MKTFDYERAWHEVAAPAYAALPDSIRALYARVDLFASEKGQLSDTSMPWPKPNDTDFGTLRAEFAIDSAELAFAARVLYFVGHWYPSSGRLVVPGRRNGSTWKFAKYADDVLADRLGLMSAHVASNPGISLRVLEGAIRICYSSVNTWTWREVAPATPAGLQYVLATLLPIVRGYETIPAVGRANREARDARVQEDFERLPGLVVWPSTWAPFMDTARFMDDESAIRARSLAYLPESDRTAARTKARASIVQTAARKIRDTEADRDITLWLFDRGHDVENVIYYAHKFTVCFGWRARLSAAEASEILDFISEFPWPYELKCADGRTLSGGLPVEPAQ